MNAWHRSRSIEAPSSTSAAGTKTTNQPITAYRSTPLLSAEKMVADTLATQIVQICQDHGQANQDGKHLSAVSNPGYMY